ncbi:hypothetical protein ABK040_009553 [Willaertia magna]
MKKRKSTSSITSNNYTNNNNSNNNNNSDDINNKKRIKPMQSIGTTIQPLSTTINNHDNYEQQEENNLSQISELSSATTNALLLMDEDGFLSVKDNFVTSENIFNSQNEEIIEHSNVTSVLNKNNLIFDIIIDFYGLPNNCKELFKEIKGVTKLYDWQERLLNLKELKEGKNLVYSLPTSGGKTLIAEIIMIRTCQVFKKKSLFILPYVSICEEKCLDLQQFSDELNFHVEGYYSSQGNIPVDLGNQLIIATIEKANGIIDNLVEENRLDELGCIVVDELHMLGEGDRGQLLEQLLSKILFIQRERKEIVKDNVNLDSSFNSDNNPEGEVKTTTNNNISKVSIQIIGMSATIPNLSEIAKWLDATLFVDNYRPVPLTEYYCIGEKVYDKEDKYIRDLHKLPIHSNSKKSDPDFVTSLCCEIIPADSVLIFCPTKQACEDCVKHLTLTLPSSQDFLEEKKLLIFQLKLLGNNDNVLLDGILFGVCYHHSGLTSEERSLLEMAYRNHILCVICCTSTLAAGINLPAKRVIFYTPYIGNKQFLTKSKYNQMSGRAGRAGIDKYGESFLILQKNITSQIDKGKELIHKELENINSCIDINNNDSLTRICLEIISSKLIQNENEIEKFSTFTFLYFQQLFDKKLIINKFKETLKLLIENKLIQLNNNLIFDITPLGLGTFKSSFTLKEALQISDLLSTCQNDGIIISNDLHLLYLCATPFNGNGLIEPNWSKYFNYFERNISTIERNIIDKCKIPEYALVTKAMNKFTKINENDQLILKRFYNAFILRDLINEKDDFISFCEIKGRGTIQQLMSQSTMFCNMIYQFCVKLDYWQLASIIKNYIKRLQFGVKSDLIDIVQLDGIKRHEIARLLFQCNLTTIEKIASFLNLENSQQEENSVIMLSLEEENDKAAITTRNYHNNNQQQVSYPVKKFIEHLITNTPNQQQQQDKINFIKDYFTVEKVEMILNSAKRELSRKSNYLKHQAEMLDNVI